MAEEFIDLYEILELPVDADRNTLRQRINELYLDAQHNLDHRHFATRVKFQQLFEVTLPQARYILLDDARRDEYNRLVRAFRGATVGGPPAPNSNSEVSPTSPPPVSPTSASGDFSPQRLEERPQSSFSFENASPIEPVPQIETDPAQLVQEREELWKKWKNGLETAVGAEADNPKSRAAVTSAPTSFSMAPAPVATSDAPVSPAAPSAPDPIPVAPAPAAKAPSAPRPKIEISFDGDEKQAPVPDSGAPETAIFGDETEPIAPSAEIEARRIEHRSQLNKEVLVNASLIWGVIGAALIVVPGLIGLIAASGHYYPRDAKALLNFPHQVLWGIGLLLIAIAAFFASRELSSRMRDKKAAELSSLSYEEFLKRIHKS